METEQILCSLCDPKSKLSHAIRSTIFKVGNLCCIQEENLIKSTLSDLKGIENISVNIIGKYVIVNHCNELCCAPTGMIIDKLNEKRLGVSVKELCNTHEVNAGVTRLLKIDDVHAAVIVVLFLIGCILSNIHGNRLLSEIFYLVCIGIAVFPVLYDSYISIVFKRNINISCLLCLVVVGSIPKRQYFDSALLLVLYTCATRLEHHLKQYINTLIETTGAGVPTTATLVTGNTIPTLAIEMDDILLIKVGEIVCCDGMVIHGNGYLDQSSVTGEAVPIYKAANDTVLSGSVLTNGYIHVKVTALPEQSTMQQIQLGVLQMQCNKGNLNRMIDTFAVYWIPAAISIAVLLVVIAGVVLPYRQLHGSSHTQRMHCLYYWIDRSLVLLLLACPCALVLSTIIPSICTIAIAARNGILIKGGSVVERLPDITMVAVDKTGTLTKGNFAIVERQYIYNGERYHTYRDTQHVDILKKGRMSEANTSPVSVESNELLYKVNNSADLSEFEYHPFELAAAIESKSSHPLAAAVTDSYCGCVSDGRDYIFPTVKEIKVIDGVGIEGWIDINSGTCFEQIETRRRSTDSNSNSNKSKGKIMKDYRCVAIGNAKLLIQNGGKIGLSKYEETLYQQFCDRNKSRVILLVAVDDELQLLLALSDIIRPEAKKFISELSTELSLVLLTGDSVACAEQVCTEVGIAKYFAELLTNDKMDYIDICQQDLRDGSSSCSISHTLFELFSEQSHRRIDNTTRNQRSDSNSDNHVPVQIIEQKQQRTQLQSLSSLLHAVCNSCELYNRQQQHRVCMIGDGINDAKALASAYVGIAVGVTGTAMAASAGDVVIMNDLSSILFAMKLCKYSKMIMYQNCILSVSIKFTAISLAIAGYLTVLNAIVIDLGCLVIVLCNGIRPLMKQIS